MTDILHGQQYRVDTGDCLQRLHEPVLPPDLFGKSADEISINIMREFEPPEGYHLADSFGKDSTVLRDLALRAGVRFDAHHSLTTIDPPELIQYGRRHHPDTVIDRPEKSFWQHIRDGMGLPMRQARWCCRELKERGGEGRRVLTGVRAEESPRRSRYAVVTPCQKTEARGKIIVAPMLHWTTAQVWDYIRLRGLPYCSLYDEGWKRLGCVFCPFERNVAKAQARWPKLFDGLLRACQAAYPQKESWHKYGSAEAVLEWWLQRDLPPVDSEEQERFAFDQFGDDA